MSNYEDQARWNGFLDFIPKIEVSNMHQAIVQADEGLTTLQLGEQEQGTEERLKKESIAEWRKKEVVVINIHQTIEQGL